MNIYKFSVTHLIVILIVLIAIFALWKYKTVKEKLSFLPQNDLYGNKVSGKNEIDFVGNNDEFQLPPPYRKVPIEDNAIYITGMNKYLWDKSKIKN
jgi:hypothetical protein